jgi:hypoxanthine phosphoribosyltransferase
MKIQVDDREFVLMLEYEQIKKRIRLTGIQIDVDFENKTPVFVGVLNGSFMFLADLMKEVNIASEVTFIRVSSYEGDTSTGTVKQVIGLEKELKGRHVIIVEDIVDTGITLEFLIHELRKQEPASICAACLLLKPQSLTKEIEELSYIAFEIPDDFVIGYGLDYNGLGRNLKHIYRAGRVPSET